jgi:hypothetical protein
MAPPRRLTSASIYRQIKPEKGESFEIGDASGMTGSLNGKVALVTGASRGKGIAIEGADKGIKSNSIPPGAVTRMADGLDISQYPPMGPDLVAPIVGWLAHESCTISGEMPLSMAGRVARAFISEIEGMYRPSSTIDEVGDNIDAIRSPDSLWTLHPAQGGYIDHLGRSFEMARQGGT